MTFAKLAAGIAVAGLTLGLAAPASADPVPATDYRLLAGSGSDTTQDVSNGLAELIDGGDTLASWNARDPQTQEVGGLITTKNPATHPQCEDIVRPNGSSQGRDALIESIDNDGVREGCFDFARSSSGATFDPAGDLAYVPAAVDAVTFAVHEDSFLPRNLTETQLRGIYQCTITSILGEPVTPVIPQAGSGTRQFWLSRVGIAEGDLDLYPCIQDRGDQEHDGAALQTTSDIVPFSIAQYIAQGNNLPGVPDRRGPAELGSVGGQAPVVSGVLNENFPITRPVYYIVPSAAVDNPADPDYQLINDVFVSNGDTAEICAPAAEAVVQQYGFLVHDECGDAETYRAFPNVLP
ncbi:substrate-binding domain-containing protein [Allonocardiopsis opalescens]|nr:substrate-binding domain-containing protein [Allonocardiopsis opalescens]